MTINLSERLEAPKGNNTFIPEPFHLRNHYFVDVRYSQCKNYLFPFIRILQRNVLKELKDSRKSILQNEKQTIHEFPVFHLVPYIIDEIQPLE